MREFSTVARCPTLDLEEGELGNAHRKPDAADLVLQPRRQCCQMREMRMFFRVLQVGVTGFALEIGSGWKAVVYRRRNV